jgi:glycosyltransferase involved in cell wall biosynthesis
MLLPMHDMHWQAVHTTYLDHLATLTVTHNTHLIIAASPRWPATIRRAVRHLVRRFPQVSALVPNNEMQLRELAATTSLIVWPGAYDPFGTVTQLGLYSGVPVITWRSGMAAELIRTSYNGVLVSQTPTTVADNNQQFLATARRIACTSTQLSDMRSHTHDLLADRQQAFIQGWQEIMEIRQ